MDNKLAYNYITVKCFLLQLLYLNMCQVLFSEVSLQQRNRSITYRLLDSLVVECWLRVREVPGSIPSQGPRHTKDVIKMVPVVPLFGTQH